MPRVLSGWPPPKWPIPLLWSSGAQFKVDGIDLDALHAKAKATSVDGHRRALQMSEGGCTDTKFFVEGLTLALNQAGAEILDITSFMEEFANNLTVYRKTLGLARRKTLGLVRRKTLGLVRRATS